MFSLIYMHTHTHREREREKERERDKLFERKIYIIEKMRKRGVSTKE